MPIKLNITIRQTLLGLRYQVRSPNSPKATTSEIDYAKALLKVFENFNQKADGKTIAKPENQ